MSRADASWRSSIPGARYVELPGTDHFLFIGDNTGEIGDLIEEFLTGSRAAVESRPGARDRPVHRHRGLDGPRRAARRPALARVSWTPTTPPRAGSVARFRGKEVKSLGDGFLATFDGPARAIRCASAITEAVRPLGIEVRTGLHTGEVELAEDDVRGIAVHIAARVAALKRFWDQCRA